MIYFVLSAELLLIFVCQRGFHFEEVHGVEEPNLVVKTRGDLFQDSALETRGELVSRW